MDRTFAITLCVLIVILAASAGTAGYSIYTTAAYKNTISGTHSYSCTITTDSSLYNVTLFIPIPADRAGNSPVVTAFGRGDVNGIPAGWKTDIFDTGKATLLKVTTPSIIPPEGTSPSHPHTVILTADTTQRTAIETRNPADAGAVFRPVQDLKPSECPGGVSAGTGAQCASFTTSLYADFTTGPESVTTIKASVTGRNSWTVFEPRSNEYRAGVVSVMTGSHKGWDSMDGILISGIGSYDIPAGL